MSVQLILFPQNYEGSYNSFIGVPNQFIVDGESFVGVNTASIVSTTNPAWGSVPFNLVFYNPATVPNTWYKYRYCTSSGCYPNVPYTTGGAAVFNIVNNSDARSGIYQKVTNLTVGAQYTITAEFSIFTTGKIRFSEIWSNGYAVSPYVFSGVSATSWTFTATETNETILIETRGAGSGNIFLDKVYLLPAGQSNSEVIEILGDGQVICDLYEDEEIPLTLSVDEFKNAAKQVQSYSKAFMLPATKRNNQIFENLFDVTRTSLGNAARITFNPYAKTQCILKQDGLVIFEGHLKMIDIQDKEGEISYNVNLYSQVTTLADILKDKKFNDIDFQELAHTYDKDSIKNSWYEPSSGTGLPLTNPLSVDSFAYDTTNQPAYGASQTNVLKYPFVDWNHQILIANGATGNNSTNRQPELTYLEQAFRPFIQIKYLIDRIFNQDDVPFSYTSSFFNTADFKKLFMDFNWGSTNNPLENEQNTYESYYCFDQGTGMSANYATTSFSVLQLGYNINLLGGTAPPNYNFGTNILTSTTTNEAYTIQYQYSVENTSGSSQTVEFQWLHNTTPINNTGTITIAANSTYHYTGIFGIQLNNTDTLQAQFKAGAGSVIRQLQNTLPSWGAFVIWKEGISSSFNFAYLQTLRGELGQWEFLKGIMKMFNLISIPDDQNPNNILIEPYGDIFINNTNSGNINDLTLKARSIAYDWTQKIDVSEIKLTPLTDLSQKIIFKFVEDDEDWAFTNYKKSTKHLYGSQIYDSTLTTGGLQSVLEGEEEIIAEPFAATVPKTLMPQFTELIVPALYSYNAADDTTQGFDNSPRIMYNNGRVTMSKGSYYIPEQNGKGSENSMVYLQFSHLSDVPTVLSSPPAATDTRDFHFGVCQLFPGLGSPTPLNLFNTYWLPYLNELYNPDTRTMTLKVNLTAGDINTFKFYDTVFIKNRQFRVNKIEYKPNDLSTVEFILIP